MVDIDFSEILSIAQTVGIVGSLVIAFYFSRREIQHLSREFQAQVLNNITEKMYHISDIIIEHPDLSKLINKTDPPEQVFAIYILSIYNQAFNMHKRKLLNDAIWAGWMQIMRSSFRDGTIVEYWDKIKTNNRFGSDFRHFINNTILARQEKT